MEFYRLLLLVIAVCILVRQNLTRNIFIRTKLVNINLRCVKEQKICRVRCQQLHIINIIYSATIMVVGIFLVINKFTLVIQNIKRYIRVIEGKLCVLCIYYFSLPLTILYAANISNILHIVCDKVNNYISKNVFYSNIL